MNLGEQAYKAGEYAKAEKLFESALKEAEGFGPNDRRLATSLNNLALLHKARGKYDQAEPLYKRALAIWEKCLGPDHPDVGASLSNLAGLYTAQAKYDQAEPLYKRSLAIKERAVGPDYPSVATSLNNLGGLYKTQGKHDQAEPLYKRSLAINKELLGPDHPDVVNSPENYALRLWATKREAEAAPMEARATIRAEVLGANHADAAQVRKSYVGLPHQGRLGTTGMHQGTGLLIIIVLGLVLGCIGFWRLWRGGRKLRLAAWIAGILAYPLVFWAVWHIHDDRLRLWTALPVAAVAPAWLLIGYLIHKDATSGLSSEFESEFESAKPPSRLRRWGGVVCCFLGLMAGFYGATHPNLRRR